MEKTRQVLSLRSIAIDVLATSRLATPKEIQALPRHIKDTLRRITLQRGTSDVEWIKALLHDRVRSLNLSECDRGTINQDLLLSIGKVSPHLVALDLNYVRVDLSNPVMSKGIFQPLKNLRILYLRHAKVSDASLSVIASHCSRLEELDLGHCESFTERGVKDLGNLPLRSVNLSFTPITDSALDCFAQGCKVRHCLQELRIDGCKLVSDDGVEAILAFCDHLKIFIFHNCPKLTARARDSLEEYLQDHHVAVKQLTWTVY